MTKSAISQARQKLQASAFEALNDSLPGLLEERLTEMRGHSLRLVATDSTTTVPLPPQLENRAEFGVQLDSVGQSYVLARVLGLFATTSKLMLKAQIARYTESERSLLISLLPQLSVNDLLIMDRGFPAIWLFTLLQKRGLPFLARMDGNQWPVVETFLQTDQAETVTSQSAIHLKRDI